jgi:hypothetical protein
LEHSSQKKLKRSGNALSAFLALPRNTSFDAQERGEKIILLIRRHWVTNTWWIAIAIFLTVLPVFLFPPLFAGEFPLIPKFAPRVITLTTVIWYLISLMFVFENFLNWYFNVSIVSNKRIIDIDFSWPLYRNVSECELDRVQDVGYVMIGLGSTVFNYGNILVQTASEITQFVFNAAPKVDKAHDIITDLVVEAGGGGGRGGGGGLRGARPKKP